MSFLISTIIPTIGRATLSRAVESVIDQQPFGADAEIIVVNDSGQPLPKMSWMEASNLQIIDTNHRERSVARNTGAAIARGKYLHFLDDDDWLLPNAFDDFCKLIHQSKAAMYYGGYRFINSNEKTLQECYPDEIGNCFIRFMSGEWQPLQASLFDAQIFHSIGGFKDLESLLGGDEDVDLTRRISLKYDIAGVQELVAVIRIARNESTTNYSNLQEQSRQSREMILSMPGAFERLHDSAVKRHNASAYWHGRMAWIYLSSVAWNIKKRNIFVAFSRLSYFGYSLVCSFKYWFSPKFWRGAMRSHRPIGWLVSSGSA
jgi:glycosyltransferase involved in cell wall biosynthesis